MEIQDRFFSLSRSLSKQWRGEKSGEVREFQKNEKKLEIRNLKELEGFERNSFDNRRLGYKLLSSLNLNDIRVCREDRDMEIRKAFRGAWCAIINSKETLERFFSFETKVYCT